MSATILQQRNPIHKVGKEVTSNVECGRSVIVLPSCIGVGNFVEILNVTRQTLGEGFSVYAIQQMLIANGAILSPPTQDELNQWEQGRIDQRNEFLLEADAETLRTVAKQEAEPKRVAMQQAQARREDETRKQRDESRGYPPLPQVWNNTLLDSHFIRKCSTETLKDLIRRFGAHQVTDALRNRN
jgi:hypothetical protein